MGEELNYSYVPYLSTNMKETKNMKKNFLCVLVAILLVINLQISVSAYNKSTVPKEFYDTSIENYPNINNYLNIVFSGDAENINIFDASDKNITEEFVLKNANKERQEIINEFAYGGYTLVVNDKIENISTRASVGITKQTPHIYKILKYDGRPTANEFGGYIRATCFFNDSIGKFTSTGTPSIYKGLLTSGNVKDIQLKYNKTVSSNSRKVTYSDFSIRVYDEQYGNNSGAGIYYDRESISYKLTFTPS